MLKTKSRCNSRAFRAAASGFIFFILALNPLFSYSQQIYTTDSRFSSDITVYVTKYRAQADVLVYKTRSSYESNGNKGVWFFTDKRFNSDKRIYFTDYRFSSDVIVYFVSNRSQAGWRNLEKKHLFY